MEDQLKVTISHNTLFMAQGGWIAKACMDRDSLLGFFVQFEYAFGAYANPKGKDMSKFQGLHISIPQMAASFKDAGYTKMSARKIEENLKELVEIGAVSKAKVTPHPRSPIIYVINEDSPHANQGLADDLAAKQRDKSAYKDQAANSAKKKEREAKGESMTLTVARNIARELTEDNTIKKFLIDYLQTSEATAKGAWTAVEGCKRYGKRITQNVFNNAVNERGVVFTQVEERRITEMRDALNKARQMDRQPMQEAPVNTPQIEAKTPNKVSWSKSKEQLKAEDQAKRDDILAEKERIAQQSFEDLLATIDL